MHYMFAVNITKAELRIHCCIVNWLYLNSEM